MSIMSRRMPRRVRNPDAFKTDKEQNDFIIQHFFKKAHARQPFMLVTRFIGSHMRRSGSEPLYEDALDVTFYLGVFGSGEPLVQITGSGLMPTLMIRTAKHVELKGDLDVESADLEILLSGIHHTPLTEPFEPPYSIFGVGLPGRHQKVSAFSLAVGTREMERLCRQESGRSDLMAGYLRAAAKLGIPLVSNSMKAAARKFKTERLKGLLEHRDAIAHLTARIRKVDASVGDSLWDNGAITVLETASDAKVLTFGERAEIQKFREQCGRTLDILKELGVERDQFWIRIGDVRYMPAILYQDLACLRPKKRKK